MRKTGTTRMTEWSYSSKLLVLMDLTILRASSTDGVQAMVPEVCDFSFLEPGYVVIGISLNGMAELQHDSKCDQCKRQIWKDDSVLAKSVRTKRDDILSSFFFPTCISCFMEDRGGYYSTALAALVMKT